MNGPRVKNRKCEFRRKRAPPQLKGKWREIEFPPPPFHCSRLGGQTGGLTRGRRRNPHQAQKNPTPPPPPPSLGREGKPFLPLTAQALEALSHGFFCASKPPPHNNAFPFSFSSSLAQKRRNNANGQKKGQSRFHGNGSGCGGGTSRTSGIAKALATAYCTYAKRQSGAKYFCQKRTDTTRL